MRDTYIHVIFMARQIMTVIQETENWMAFKFGAKFLRMLHVLLQTFQCILYLLNVSIVFPIIYDA